MAAADELEYISTDWDASVCLYFLHYFTDKGVVGRIFFYAHYTVTSSGYQFDADASCPRKQIKSYDSFFEIDVVVEHVKQILFCKVCSRTCFECTWHVESSSFVYTADYSHVNKASISMLEVGFMMKIWRMNARSFSRMASFSSDTPVRCSSSRSWSSSSCFQAYNK